MTLKEIIKNVQALSVAEQLALIEATTNMARRTVEQIAPTAAEQVKALAYSASLAHVAADLINRPDPEPESQLRYGMFAGRLDLDEELFETANWHPSEEELALG
jgi:hypothetical protein